MRSESLHKNYEVYINCAILAVSAANFEKGFRQKDARFYIELFSNWVECRFEGPGLELQNTQIGRVLDGLATEGLLKRSLQNKRPIYRPHSFGFIELAQRCAHSAPFMMEDFIFLYHFLKLYKEKILALLLNKKGRLSRAAEIELEHLLDPQSLIESRVRSLKIELEKLKARAQESAAMSRYAKAQISSGRPPEEMLAQMSEKYPYQLNNQKPMIELMQELPMDLRSFELTEAPHLRAVHLWRPLISYYEACLGALERLS